jgi:hypothetical protein
LEETIKTLLDTRNKALITFTKKCLVGEEVDIEELWNMPRVKRTLKKQQSNGSWIYPNKKAGIAFTHKLQPVPNIQDNSRISGILWI